MDNLIKGVITGALALGTSIWAANAANKPVDLYSYGNTGIWNEEIFDHLWIPQPSDFHVREITKLVKTFANNSLDKDSSELCGPIKHVMWDQAEIKFSSPYLNEDISITCSTNTNGLISKYKSDATATLLDGSAVDLNGRTSDRKIHPETINYDVFLTDRTKSHYNYIILPEYEKKIWALGLYPKTTNAGYVLWLEEPPFHVDVRTYSIPVPKIRDSLWSLKLPQKTTYGLTIKSSLEESQITEIHTDNNFWEINLTYIPLDRKSDVQEAFQDSLYAESIRRADDYNQWQDYTWVEIEIFITKDLSGHPVSKSEWKDFISDHEKYWLRLKFTKQPHER